MAAVIDNLRAAVRFIMNFFNYIMSFLSGNGGNAEGEDVTE